MNRYAINAAPTNGSIALPAGAPVDTWFWARAVALTTFNNFVGFRTGASDGIYVDADVPAGADVRIGWVFAGGGAVKYYDGAAWVSSAVPEDLMTVAQVNAADPAIWTATGGFDVNSPHIAPVVYLKTTVATAIPSVNLVQIGYNSGASARPVWLASFAQAVPVPGGDDLPAGLYVWDTANAYRHEDGATDDGNPIQKLIQTHEVRPRSGARGWFREVILEVESEAGDTLTVTAIIDGVRETPIDGGVVTVAAGIDYYEVGIPHGAGGVGCAVEVAWGGDAKIYSIGFREETAGTSRV